MLRQAQQFDEYMPDQFTIAGRKFKSRLITGTGKHRSIQEMLASVAASGCEIVTVAIRRLNLDDPTKRPFWTTLIWII